MFRLTSEGTGTQYLGNLPIQSNIRNITIRPSHHYCIVCISIRYDIIFDLLKVTSSHFFTKIN